MKRLVITAGYQVEPATIEIVRGPDDPWATRDAGDGPDYDFEADKLHALMRQVLPDATYRALNALIIKATAEDERRF